MTYGERIVAAQAKAEMIYKNQLVYAKSVFYNPELTLDEKEHLLKSKGLFWTIKVILENERYTK